jgi:hypothetical protein
MSHCVWMAERWVRSRHASASITRLTRPPAHQKEPAVVAVPVEAAHLASCVALTQEHRGHGVSTAGYYLGRALVGQGLHVLLGDLSQRPSTLLTLAAHDPLKNLVPWTPGPVLPTELPRLIESARKRTAGLADVLVLDIDATLLEGAGGLAAGVDYIVLLVENTPDAQAGAERLGRRLGGMTTPRGRMGVVFSRVDAPSADELPRQLESGLPVLGWLPADYLLAAGEAYSLKGGAPAQPHEAYLNALSRLAQGLVRLVPLHRGQARTASGRTA